MKVPLTKGGGVQGRLPGKILKLRPSDMAFPAILESSFGNFGILSLISARIVAPSSLFINTII
jgi:hypothetical protein